VAAAMDRPLRVGGEERLVLEVGGGFLDIEGSVSYTDQAPRFEECCPDRSLRARWRCGLVAVGLGRAFERIGGGLCRLSRIGGSVRCQVVGGGFAGGR
jgi:hypothetical protein